MDKIKAPLIFVVEDNVFYNQLIVDNLAKQKFTNVKFFYSGEECLKNMNLKPDIIIQDYNLEGMNGVEVLQRAKKIYPEAEFLFLSAQESTEVAVNSMRYGAFDYIVKDGIVFDKVINKIKRILFIKKLAKQNKLLKFSMVAFFIIVVILVVLVFILNFKGYF